MADTMSSPAALCGEATEIDAHFANAGLAALLAHHDAKLIAGANHRENFTLWAALIAHYAMIDVIDYDNENHIRWFNRYCRCAREGWRPSYEGELVPASENRFTIAVCHAAYAKLRGG